MLSEKMTQFERKHPTSLLLLGLMALGWLGPWRGVCQAEPVEFLRFPKVQVQSRDNFFSADFADMVSGRFADKTQTKSCGQALATLSDGRVELVDWVSGERKISSFDQSFPFSESVVADFDGDGRDDILGYDRKEKIWRLAFSQGNGEFLVRNFPMPEWTPLKLRFLLHERDGRPEVIVNSRNLRQRLSYAADSGIRVLSLDTPSEDTVIAGLLSGPRDRLQHLSPEVFYFRNVPSSYFRHSDEGLRAILGIPIPIHAEEFLSWDMNRDGFEDLLLSGWHLGMWWVGFGEKEGTIGYPVSGLHTLGLEPNDVMVADIDCDGFKELFARKGSKGSLRFSKGAESTPTPQGTFGRAISDSKGPFVCVAYKPFSRKMSWGYDDMCPRGYAVIGSSYDENVRGNACCRLPDADILSETSVMVRGSCPEDYVVTGYTSAQEFRCTKINVDRYRLSAKLSGVHWGFGSMKADEEKDIQTSAIPVSFRHAVGRLGFQSWEEEGCIGPKWGSLLTGWKSKKCFNHSYQAIEYAGKPGDPPLGTPVKIFPDCPGTVNRFDPDAGCEPSKTPDSMMQQLSH